MSTPAEIVELLAQDPSGLERGELLAGLRAAEAHAVVDGGAGGPVGPGAGGLPKDPSCPAKDWPRRWNGSRRWVPVRPSAGRSGPSSSRTCPRPSRPSEDGGITDAHADVLAQHGQRPTPRPGPRSRRRKPSCWPGRQESPYEFAKRVDRFVQKHSQDDGRSEWDKKKARQRLTLSPAGDGMTRSRGCWPPSWRSGPSECSARSRTSCTAGTTRTIQPTNRSRPWSSPTNNARPKRWRRSCGGPNRSKGRPQRRPRRRLAALRRPGRSRAATMPRHWPTARRSGLGRPAHGLRRRAHPPRPRRRVLPARPGASQAIASPSQRSVLFALWSTCSFADCTAPSPGPRCTTSSPSNTADPPTSATSSRPAPACHDLAHAPGWSFTKTRKTIDHHHRPRRPAMAPTCPTGPPDRTGPISRAAPGGGHPTRTPPGPRRHPLPRRRLTLESTLDIAQRVGIEARPGPGGFV